MKIGDKVNIPKFNRNGYIIHNVDDGTMWIVKVGSRNVLVRDDEIKPIDTYLEKIKKAEAYLNTLDYVQENDFARGYYCGGRDILDRIK